MVVFGSSYMIRVLYSLYVKTLWLSQYLLYKVHRINQIHARPLDNPLTLPYNEGGNDPGGETNE